MQLADFTELIRNMPVRHQAFTSKRSTWGNHLVIPGAAGNALHRIFGGAAETTISRSDLRNFSTLPALDQFVMATILWGYPRGMRGNHVASLINNFATLTGTLSTAREHKDIEWDDHYLDVVNVRGVGLSTYTKFLSFLSVRIQRHEALILDDRIINVVQQGVFEELEPLQGLARHNAARRYPAYVTFLYGVAAELAVPAENLEFFLFEFGLHLKPVAPRPNVGAAHP